MTGDRLFCPGCPVPSEGLPDVPTGDMCPSCRHRLDRHLLHVAGRRWCPTCDGAAYLLPIALVGHGGRRWECGHCGRLWREGLSGDLTRAAS